MRELTVSEIKDKIVQATQDIDRLNSDGNPKQAEILGQYLEYLKDELKEAEQKSNG
jgi:hypothetical protein